MSASDAATTTASTKRRPAVSGGKVGAPVTNLASLSVVPLLPVSAETRESVQLESPREAKETYAFADSNNTLPDVVEGDLLVVSGTEYVIKGVAEYSRPSGGSFLHIVCEEQKGS